MELTRSTSNVDDRALRWWQAIAAGAAAGTVANLVIFFIGRAAGASFVYTDGGVVRAVTTPGVIIASAFPLVVGAGLAALLRRWWRAVIRLAQLTGGALALLTVAGPLMAETDGGTRSALAAMHIVLGIAVVLTLESMRPRTQGTGGQGTAAQGTATQRTATQRTAAQGTAAQRTATQGTARAAAETKRAGAA